MRLLAGLSATGLLIFVGCSMLAHGDDDDHGVTVTKAMCVLAPTQGSSVSGWVMFEQKAGHITVTAEVKGLTPGKHGFHIHEWGDVSGSDGKKTGGHFNPGGHDHSGKESEKRHMGDLGNIVAGADGMAKLTWDDKILEMHMIVGRGMIVHAGTDDLTSQPTGAAGARAAQGVIGIAAQK